MYGSQFIHVHWTQLPNNCLCRASAFFKLLSQTKEVCMSYLSLRQYRLIITRLIAKGFEGRKEKEKGNWLSGKTSKSREEWFLKGSRTIVCVWTRKFLSPPPPIILGSKINDEQRLTQKVNTGEICSDANAALWSILCLIRFCFIVPPNFDLASNLSFR